MMINELWKSYASNYDPINPWLDNIFENENT